MLTKQPPVKKTDQKTKQEKKDKKHDVDEKKLEEPEYEHPEPQYRVVGYILENGNIIPKNGRYVWSIEFTDDFHSRRGPFSICSSE